MGLCIIMFETSLLCWLIAKDSAYVSSRSARKLLAYIYRVRHNKTIPQVAGIMHCFKGISTIQLVKVGEMKKLNAISLPSSPLYWCHTCIILLVDIVTSVFTMSQLQFFIDSVLQLNALLTL